MSGARTLFSLFAFVLLTSTILPLGFYLSNSRLITGQYFILLDQSFFTYSAQFISYYLTITHNWVFLQLFLSSTIRNSILKSLYNKNHPQVRSPSQLLLSLLVFSTLPTSLSSFFLVPGCQAGTSST